ncbi:MAG: glycosyltransferase, partial [Terracidiphilus sp.]
MSEARPLKVLVSAFAFNPTKGSECSVGWDYVRAIAAKHKVWVITRALEREETEQYLLQHPHALANLSVQYVQERFRNLTSPLGHITNYWRYKVWQWDAYVLARELDARIDFDVVHQLNGTGFREPGHLWKLGKPFVWGPIGGLQFTPFWLLNAVPFGSRVFCVLKGLSTLWAMHVSRRPRRAAATAQVILASSSNVAEKVHALWGRDAITLCEVSAPDLEPRALVRRGPGEPLRIVWSGTCNPLKALNIVLLSLGQLKQSFADWRLIVIGDGPLWESWKRLAGKLGLAEHCSFLGRVPRAEALSVMATGHCFVQPSLYDATSTVVAEALAHRLPVLCLDHFGFRDAVNSACGVKIPPNQLDQVI